MTTRLLLLVCPFAAVSLWAQSAGPLSAGSKGLFEITKNNVLKAAQEMPDENYSFRPTETVRTFGELVGHVADGQYEFCSVVLDDKSEHPGVEKTAKTKAELIKALETAFSYCDKAYSSLTDAHAADMVTFFKQKRAKLTILDFNSMHNYEHYGNMVTYLRVKGLVPPSSKQ